MIKEILKRFKRVIIKMLNKKYKNQFKNKRMMMKIIRNMIKNFKMMNLKVSYFQIYINIKITFLINEFLK